MLTVYATWRNSDMIEGRGPMVMDKVFAVERDAQIYINMQEGISGRKPEHGWQNSEWGDWQVKRLYIREFLEDSEEYVRVQTLNNAYAKLTETEQRVLEDHIRDQVSRGK